MSKIQAVLFDKDDTLMELESFWVQVTREVVAAIVMRVKGENDPELFDLLLTSVGIRNGWDVVPESILVSGTNLDMSKAWEACLCQNGQNVPEEFYALVEIFFEKSYLQIKPTPTTKDLRGVMLKLKEMGLKIGVATSDSYNSTEYCLKELNILDLMDGLFTADRVAKPKPEPDSLFAASAAWGIAPAEFVMVGDSRVDMELARRGGGRGIYVGKQADLPPCAVTRIADLANLPDCIADLTQA